MTFNGYENTEKPLGAVGQNRPRASSTTPPPKEIDMDNLYYIQYKPLDRANQAWDNLVAFPMTWERVTAIFESLREIAGPDFVLRTIDIDGE